MYHHDECKELVIQNLVWQLHFFQSSVPYVIGPLTHQPPNFCCDLTLVLFLFLVFFLCQSSRKSKANPVLIVNLYKLPAATVAQLQL